MVRTYASGLRAALGLGGAGRLPGLAKEPGGYRLALAPGDLDLDVFNNLSARGRDALARGDATRAAQLLAELGIEPSAQTRDLHQQILADKPALAPAHEPTMVPRQLPGDVRDFTGRDATLAAMMALLPGKAGALTH